MILHVQPTVKKAMIFHCGFPIIQAEWFHLGVAQVVEWSSTKSACQIVLGQDLEPQIAPDVCHWRVNV